MTAIWMRKVSNAPFVDFAVVLDASLDINCSYMYFMIRVNSPFIEL